MNRWLLQGLLNGIKDSFSEDIHSHRSAYPQATALDEERYTITILSERVREVLKNIYKKKSDMHCCIPLSFLISQSGLSHQGHVPICSIYLSLFIRSAQPVQEYTRIHFFILKCSVPAYISLVGCKVICLVN